MYRIGLSANDLSESAFLELHKSGIHAIEITMGAYKDINHKEVKYLFKKYGIELWSYHLPFYGVDPSSPNRALRSHTIEVFSEMIRKASDIGLDKFVIHASSEPIADEQREEHLRYSMESLNILAELAHQNGACIAVEDLPRTCLGNTAEEMLRLLSANDKLKVCFDTNHLLKDNNIHFMDKLADKIVTVHISDYDFVDEKHWLPGEGKVDWNMLLAKFQEIGYDGVWLYEVALKSTKTMIRDRDLTYKDVYDNAMSLFSGMKPAVLGRYKNPLL